MIRFYLILEVILLSITSLTSSERAGDLGGLIISTATSVPLDTKSNGPSPTVTPLAVNKTSGKSEAKPLIYYVSSEQVVEIDSGHEKVTLTCGVIGEDITGGYWEKVDGNLSSLHNKSKPLLHNHGKTILKMVIVRARPSNSGDYRCVVYNQWGVSKSRNVQVTIRVAPPEIITQPTNISIIALHDGMLTCKAQGYRAKYQWRRHKIDKIIGNQPNLTISKVTPQDEDQYYCVVVTKGGYAFSNNVSVTVIDYINLVIQPSHAVFVKGESINIEITAEGPGKENFTYFWKRVSHALSNTTTGKHTSNLMITSIAPSDSGSYYCMVMNQWGNKTESDRATITVILSIKLYPENQTVPTGQTIELTCDVYSTGTDNDLVYQWTNSRWQSTPAAIEMIRHNVLRIHNADVNDSGVYNCIVFNAGSNSTIVKSNSANVTILALPEITIHPNSSGDITVAEGSNVTLLCEATGGGTLNYQWTRVSESLPEVVLWNMEDTHLMISNITVNDIGKYYCKVDNGGTRVSSMGVQVLVKRRPVINSVSGDQALNITSNNESIFLTCNVTGDNITAYWEKLHGSLPDKRHHTFFNGSEVILTITRAHPHDTGDYMCTVCSPWGVPQSRIISVLIVAAPPIFIHQPTNKSVIALENVTFIGEAKGFHVRYEWRFFYSDSDSYVVKGNSSTLSLIEVTPSDKGHYCCVAITGEDNQVLSHNVTLTVNDSFVVLQDPEYIVPINSSVTLYAATKGPGTDHFKYHWVKNDSNSLPSTASGQDTPNLIISPVTISDGGSYYCNVTNQWGTTVVSNIGLVQVFNVKLQPQNQSVHNLGSSVNISCVSSILSSVEYQWKHNGTVLENETSAILSISNVQWNKTGVYICMTVKGNVFVESDGGYLTVLGSAKLVERDVANKSWTILIIIGCVLAVVITVIIVVICCYCICYILCKCIPKKQVAAPRLELSQQGITIVAESDVPLEQTAIACPANQIQVSVTNGKDIMTIINTLHPELRKLDVQHLIPYLNENNVLTIDVKQYLQLKEIIDIDKIDRLLLYLDSTNEETQIGFVKAVYKSSQQQGSNEHHKIIEIFQANGIIINELTSEQ